MSANATEGSHSPSIVILSAAKNQLASLSLRMAALPSE